MTAAYTLGVCLNAFVYNTGNRFHKAHSSVTHIVNTTPKLQNDKEVLVSSYSEPILNGKMFSGPDSQPAHSSGRSVWHCCHQAPPRPDGEHEAVSSLCPCPR